MFRRGGSLHVRNSTVSPLKRQFLVISYRTVRSPVPYGPLRGEGSIFYCSFELNQRMKG